MLTRAKSEFQAVQQPLVRCAILVWKKAPEQRYDQRPAMHTRSDARLRPVRVASAVVQTVLNHRAQSLGAFAPPLKIAPQCLLGCRTSANSLPPPPWTAAKPQSPPNPWRQLQCREPRPTAAPALPPEHRLPPGTPLLLVLQPAQLRPQPWTQRSHVSAPRSRPSTQQQTASPARSQPW